METANSEFASVFAWMRRISLLCLCCALSSPVGAVGTAVGTIIENTAVVSYDLAGTPLTLQSNTTTLAVAERVDVTVTLQSAQTPVAPGETGSALLFTVTNTGNGTETFQLSIDSLIAGDDFDPTPAVPGIYFDTDGSGDFNGGDQSYAPGTNDPDLLADESISIFIVNDIPAGVANGQTGRSELIATSATGAGVPGTVYAGLGDGGLNAVIGSTGGEALDTGEYLVSDVLVSVVKSQLVSDPFGGTEPVPGATLTYTIVVNVINAGTASASILRDVIPTFSTYVPNSITLNGGAISDLADTDDGEFDTSGAPTVVVRLGDLTLASGPQEVVFQAVID
ncbi:MAG: hypothetical protein OEQ90_05525 [Gammaproteobacteria bacterium]|nr:hypothetical protein [Gammaproteobacteria bacterium]